MDELDVDAPLTTVHLGREIDACLGLPERIPTADRLARRPLWAANAQIGRRLPVS